jgi:hypothetical protein
MDTRWRFTFDARWSRCPAPSRSLALSLGMRRLALADRLPGILRASLVSGFLGRRLKPRVIYGHIPDEIPGRPDTLQSDTLITVGYW